MVVHKPAGHSKCSSLEDVLPRSSMFYHGAEFVGVVLLCITSSQTKARAKRATGGLGAGPQEEGYVRQSYEVPWGKKKAQFTPYSALRELDRKLSRNRFARTPSSPAPMRRSPGS
jgi:hypothetical protein